jgi:MoxR-like ATPase
MALLRKANPALPLIEQPQKPAMPGRADFRSAMASPAPPDFSTEWDWADNPEWMDEIDGFTPAELNEIIEERLHEPVLTRVRAAVEATQKLFCNRDQAIEIMVACAIARVNLVYLGPPGTAKSELVRAFARTLGVRPTSRPIHEEEAAAADARKNGERGRGGRPLFEYLLTRYTTPEELFGGADINLLLNKGVYGRRTAGMLPQAEIGFLDELFKANTAILNALLSLTNERLYYNMGQAFKVNLAFVVGASNETPAEEELGALYDRFPIRVPCLPVNQKQLLKVVQMAHDLDREKVDRLACLNDIRLLAKVAWAQESFGGVHHAFPRGEDRFKNQFENFLTAFRDEFRISDRTPYRILRLCRSLALLDGATVPGPKQLRAWGYVAPRVASTLDLQQLVRKRIQQEDQSCDGDKLFDKRG